MKPVDLAGQRFGRVVALRRVGSKWGNALWKYRCDCGADGECTVAELRNRISCGCAQKEMTAARSTKHGLRKSRAYNSWQAMKQRCENPRAIGWKNYGGRGVEVCQRWKESFEAFVSDMGQPPPGMSIERVNNSLGYEPGNCVWATDFAQQRNKRTNRIIEFDGQRLPASVWAERIGISAAALHMRLKQGWSAERALSQPLRITARTRRPVSLSA